MSGGHSIRITSWATVLLIITGFIVLGFALPLQSLTLGIIGGVVLLVGLVMAGVTRVMDDAY